MGLNWPQILCQTSHQEMESVSHPCYLSLTSGWHWPMGRNRSHILRFPCLFSWNPETSMLWFEVGGRFLWLSHVDVWQKPTQYCKAIILRIKLFFFKRNPRCKNIWRYSPRNPSYSNHPRWGPRHVHEAMLDQFTPAELSDECSCVSEPRQKQ